MRFDDPGWSLQGRFSDAYVTATESIDGGPLFVANAHVGDLTTDPAHVHRLEGGWDGTTLRRVLDAPADSAIVAGDTAWLAGLGLQEGPLPPPGEGVPCLD